MSSAQHALASAHSVAWLNTSARIKLRIIPEGWAVQADALIIAEIPYGACLSLWTLAAASCEAPATWGSISISQSQTLTTHCIRSRHQHLTSLCCPSTCMIRHRA